MSVGHLRICSPFGIPVRLHYTWWLIFFPVLGTLGLSIYPRFYPDLNEVQTWTMAGLATVLLFVSLLLHELGHAAAAMRFGIAVHSVELFLLGGAARMIGFTRRPRDEFLLAAAGPAVSLAFAVLAMVAYVTLHHGFGLTSPVVDVPVHVAAFNLATVAFNLLPAYPLDGGRVVQGLLWHWMGNRRRAAVAPTAVGVVVGTGLAVFGLWQLAQAVTASGDGAAQQHLAEGIWPAIIGVFVALAAWRSWRGVCLTDRIAHLTVRNALDERVRPLSGDAPLASARQEAFGGSDVPAAPVVGADGRAEAVLVAETLGDPAPEATVAEAAEEISPGGRVAEDADLFGAALKMARRGDPWLVVEDAEGRYVGMLTGPSLRRAMHGE